MLYTVLHYIVFTLAHNLFNHLLSLLKSKILSLRVHLIVLSPFAKIYSQRFIRKDLFAKIYSQRFIRKDLFAKINAINNSLTWLDCLRQKKIE